MRKRLIIGLGVLTVCGSAAMICEKYVRPGIPAQVELPNAWMLTPVGRQIDLPGDMPMRIVVSPDAKELLVSIGGFHDHGLYRLDLAGYRLTQSLSLGKTWTGMCGDSLGTTFYLSSGGPMSKSFADKANAKHFSPEAIKAQSEPLLCVDRGTGGQLDAPKGMPIQGLAEKDRWISGLTLSNGSLYAANLPNDSVYKLDPKSGEVQASAKVGYRPYGVAVSPDGKTVAVTNWGGESVTLLNANLEILHKEIHVGSHPCEVAWSKDGARFFVCCSGGDTVSVLNSSGEVKERIRVSPDPGGPSVRVTPDALALSPDGNRLFVADAGTNCVAVVDTSTTDHSRVLGFIPTGWYPTAVAVAPDGRTLYIGVGKGLRSRASVPALTKDGKTQPDGTGHQDYVCDCLTGAIAIVDLPDAATLATYSRSVVENLPHPKPETPDAADKVADGKTALKNIKHVLYIIRENRTYDQVLGDISKGNGDPSLVIFGRNVTPNAHQLVENGVLLDNFYCDGEVSEDGHQWCDAAYATDFTEKGYVNSYSGRGEPDADERLTSSPAGYLWNNCQKHGLTYKSYGEYAWFESSPNSPPVFTGEKGLDGHGSPEWSKLGGWITTDRERSAVFIKDLRAGEKSGILPQFMIMHLFSDHTQGLLPKAFTPVAHVADNDQALGKIVEAISHSKFWKDTAIFVIEDDAQDGPDHVDCHRSVALVVSPYARQRFVDHTHYTTSSFVRTIELILGLPAMTEFDSHATPLWGTFTSAPDLSAYNCQPALVDLEAKNPDKGIGAAESAQLDWSDVDRADPQKLNAILWHALKPGIPVPAPVRSAEARVE